MKTKVFLILAVVLALTASAVHADTVTGTGTFQAFTAGNVNDNGAPYWDNKSYDGGAYNPTGGLYGGYNVGYFITKTGQYAGGGTIPVNNSPALATPYFYGGAYNSGADTGGAATTNFYFTRDCPTSSAAVLLTLAGNLGTNVFGWYDVGTGALNPLFTGDNTTPPAGESASVLFNPTATYGYYLHSGVTGDTWYTESSRNGAGQTGDQHFALFQSSLAGDGTYYIGAEDVPFTDPLSDRDYNDIVVRASCVPLPGALLLLGGGLVRLVAYGRRRKIAV